MSWSREKSEVFRRASPVAARLSRSGPVALFLKEKAFCPRSHVKKAGEPL
jgi:hypothetical protein